jgi:hypothetical protein
MQQCGHYLGYTREPDQSDQRGNEEKLGVPPITHPYLYAPLF